MPNPAPLLPCWSVIVSFLRLTVATLATIAVAASAGACSAAAPPDVETPKDGGAGDVLADGPTLGCAAPTAAPPWLAEDLAGHLSKLTGAIEITAGVRLTDRATPDRRSATRTYLSAELTALGIRAIVQGYTGGANVVAMLPATSEGAAGSIVVGAHFDGVAGSPGANDNASGVAAVLAVARALRDLPCRSLGVTFVFFDQEEVGLLGSKAFAAAQETSGIVAAHTVDQVGWDADGDRVFEIERPTASLFAEYQAAATAVGAKVVETRTTTSDHQSFRTRGIPAAGVTEEYVGGDTTPHAHSATDTTSTVDASYHGLAVRLVTYVVARELGAP